VDLEQLELLSDAYGQQNFSNDFLAILEVTRERTGSNPYPECVLPVSLVCRHLESFSGALKELNE